MIQANSQENWYRIEQNPYIQRTSKEWKDIYIPCWTTSFLFLSLLKLTNWNQNIHDRVCSVMHACVKILVFVASVHFAWFASSVLQKWFSSSRQSSEACILAIESWPDKLIYAYSWYIHEIAKLYLSEQIIKQQRWSNWAWSTYI